MRVAVFVPRASMISVAVSVRMGGGSHLGRCGERGKEGKLWQLSFLPLTLLLRTLSIVCRAQRLSVSKWALLSSLDSGPYFLAPSISSRSRALQGHIGALVERRLRHEAGQASPGRSAASWWSETFFRPSFFLFALDLLLTSHFPIQELPTSFGSISPSTPYVRRTSSFLLLHPLRSRTPFQTGLILQENADPVSKQLSLCSTTTMCCIQST